MYIIELFLKIVGDLKQGRFKKAPPQEEAEVEKCDHMFVPIDSTGRVLACSKCGEIYKLKKGEVNPFKN